ncbi:MAG: hypothetical protein OXQ31_22195 [Spirochaetaceae bacterium]|nr:hypothetical protein [Spirochaetaceae bacterium]
MDAWDQRHASRCFVSIVNSRQWRAITGERPPNTPPTAAQYAKAGFPWFDYYSEADSVDATDALKGVSSVANLGAQMGEAPLPENDTASVDNVVPLGAGRPAPTSRQVREMP